MSILLTLSSIQLPSAAQDVQQVTVVSEVSTSGTIQYLNASDLTIVDADGKSQSFKIQSQPDQPISIAGGSIAVEEVAKINVTGSTNISALRPGMIIKVQADLALGSKTGKVSSIELLPSDAPLQQIQFAGNPPEGRDYARASVVGRVISNQPTRLTVSVPKGKFALRGRLSFKTNQLGPIQFQTTSLTNVMPGDVITALNAAKVSSGELIVRSIEIQKVDLLDEYRLTLDEQLWLKFADLSNTPRPPREMNSKHFSIATDMSDRESSVLLSKLETMVELISDYYGARPRKRVSCVVVKDLLAWNAGDFDPRVLNKIRNREGMTIYRQKGAREEAVVYSAANHGVVQHEAVHAFCFLTFGGTGPLWYAEGMAEMGQYWIPDDNAVRADAMTIGYLQNTQPQNLLNIIAAERIEGEAWKAYAWRWALCHLLANNPNYAQRFRNLGLDMMRGGQGTFENTFGDVAAEISFEYQQFLKHLRAGHRVDLTAWQWNVKAKPLGRNRTLKAEIQAAGGWQATPVKVLSGKSYSIKSDGKWQLSANGLPVTGEGDGSGAGKLVGVIFSDYQLSPEFEIGAEGSFTADRDGQLFLRCRDSFSDLEDNRGQLSVQITQK